ncbi:nucleoside-diphosphate sugar epimerase/dehydratase [Domibacillus sp. PGB-M46]|uniref:polysaccharide biosynthesis protein n=1 Tax=Domibacillus sp. PGB-M46 TaxID=2910255 RepID=UPI00272D62A4|nr:nucleoside-diphosphate sugar epimerase/dehydratase [Domibacillus sp. PGB-M46]
MSYKQRIPLFLFIDSCIVLTAIFISQFLVGATVYVVTGPILISSISILLCHHTLAIQFKLYKKVWAYASTRELVIILKVVTYSTFFAALTQQLIVQNIHFRLLAVTWLLHLLFIGGSRLAWRMYHDAKFQTNENKKNTLIIGAGAAGTMVARQLLNNHETDLVPVAFIDDDMRKHSLDILGLPVAGNVTEIGKVVQKRAIENIIIAIPSLSKKELNIIYQECAKTKVKTQILPMLEDLVTGKVSVNQFRDVQVEDLLGRDPVEMDIDSVADFLTDKVVLVTGAGGSIGSELCRQISAYNPKQLILLGRGENSIYSIEMDLKERFKTSAIDIVTEIADLQDREKIVAVIQTYRPDVVYHAAAHKHVPLMERNPEEAVKNNIIGTLNVAQAASEYNVDTFVMISTDKAVNPTSVMGATKRLAEMIIQGMDQQSSTRFVAVRFGNVLGSRGSVIPLFKKQIEKGGPVTVTHPDMIRYFMTIPEASRLVIQAGALAKGGEIFVLDMGEPVKIVDLAKNLITLSGYSVEDIGLAFTGVRPGEKLFEELLQKDEVSEQQVYPKIYIGKTAKMYLSEIEHITSVFSSLSKEELRDTLLNVANNRPVFTTKEEQAGREPVLSVHAPTIPQPEPIMTIQRSKEWVR